MMIAVCERGDIPANGAREFSLSHGEQSLDCFIVHHASQFYAYQNSCPHTGGPLNWQPHGFLDLEQRHIQCGIHGALFNISDGLCIWGPCQGRRLSPLPLQEREGRLYIEL